MVGLNVSPEISFAYKEEGSKWISVQGAETEQVLITAFIPEKEEKTELTNTF